MNPTTDSGTLPSHSRPQAEADSYVGAYPFLENRRAIWREIVRYMEPDFGNPEVVVEFGAGYGDFINQIRAKTRIAFDLNPEMRAFAAPEVDWREEDARAVSSLAPASLDLVFASNFFEHLHADASTELLDSVRTGLRVGGRIALLQPNHNRCAEHYFDDPTHVAIFNDDNIGPWLEAHGFRLRRLVPGLLPFSMKSNVPKWPLLVRCYLHSPIRPLSAQMYVVAERI